MVVDMERAHSALDTQIPVASVLASCTNPQLAQRVREADLDNGELSAIMHLKPYTFMCVATIEQLSLMAGSIETHTLALCRPPPVDY